MHKSCIKLLLTLLFFIMSAANAYSQNISMPDIAVEIGDTITVPVMINDAPNDVASFGVDIGFCSDNLSFQGCNFTDTLVEGFAFKNCNPINGGTIIRVGGFAADDGFPSGSNGSLVNISFEVVSCDSDEPCDFVLQDLLDNFAGWTTENGGFSCVDVSCNDCDDGDPCNGVEVCVDGVCQPGSPVVCPDDGNICNGTETCDGGVCIHSDAPLGGTDCNDNNPCTEEDRCEDGICLGTVKDCRDCDVCTDNVCDSNTGHCISVNNTKPCDDGNPCTDNDSCTDGICAGEHDNGQNQPPVCSAAEPSIPKIWSPNHKMVDINILGVTDPDGDPVTITIDSITQDEPVNAEGDGNTSPDGEGVDTDTAKVRAESSGQGNGRVYEISFTADDGQCGVCEGSVRVCVPHDKGKNSDCTDDGQSYDSTDTSPDQLSFEVTIDLHGDPDGPVIVCFMPDQPLNEDPIATLVVGEGTLSHGNESIPPGSELRVSHTNTHCSDDLVYCVDYWPTDSDSEVEIMIEEDPGNTVIPGSVAFQVADFEINEESNSATSFCITNEAGGSGSLKESHCDRDMAGFKIGKNKLDLRGAKNNNGTPAPMTVCITVTIVAVEDAPVTKPTIPGIMVSGIYDVKLPEGIVIAYNQNATISISFVLPAGMSQPEFEDVVRVLYYNEENDTWQSDGIDNDNLIIEWDSGKATGTITFNTAHLTEFAAAATPTASVGDSGDGSQAASGNSGCSITDTDHKMSASSAAANTLIFLLPLIIFGIGRKRKKL